jgi:hypothetical protein
MENISSANEWLHQEAKAKSLQTHGMNQHFKSIKVCPVTAQVTSIPDNTQSLGKRLYTQVASCD